MRYCGFKKKSHSFSKSLNETHGVAELQVKTLRVEKTFFYWPVSLEGILINLKWFGSKQDVNYCNIGDAQTLVKIEGKVP